MSRLSLIQERSLQRHESKRIANDPNCQRTFMGKDFSEVHDQYTQWYKIAKDGQFAGAIMIDRPEMDMACHHILALKDALTRDECIDIVKMAVKISIIRELKPYAMVSRDPSYDYMRKFLHDCGLEMSSLTHSNIDIFSPPAIEYVKLLHTFETKGSYT